MIGSNFTTGNSSQVIRARPMMPDNPLGPRGTPSSLLIRCRRGNSLACIMQTNHCSSRFKCSSKREITPNSTCVHIGAVTSDDHQCFCVNIVLIEESDDTLLNTFRISTVYVICPTYTEFGS